METIEPQMTSIIDSILKTHKNFVFIGESGSGKTEIALNMAAAMNRASEKEIHFFDMDQTKPLFRARDRAANLEDEGVFFHYQSQFLDAPTVVSGVIGCLKNDKACTLMDVGGGKLGAQMIGQFSRYLGKENSQIFYIINPFRPWSANVEDIEYTMSQVLGASRLSATSIVANPNLGPDTEAKDILTGIEKIREMFPRQEIKFVCTTEQLRNEVEKNTEIPVFPITINLLPEWFL